MNGTFHFKLNEQQARELYSWLDARLDEMLPEEESIEEEAPGLMEALRVLREAVEP